MEGLQELMEALAESVHDEWMRGRIKAGWTYGEKRDDEKKQTPCLVPYHELPEVLQNHNRGRGAAQSVSVMDWRV